MEGPAFIYKHRHRKVSYQKINKQQYLNYRTNLRKEMFLKAQDIIQDLEEQGLPCSHPSTFTLEIVENVTQTIDEYYNDLYFQKS